MQGTRRKEAGGRKSGWSCAALLVCVIAAEWGTSVSCQSFLEVFSNCSVSKLRLINCRALSGFKDPRCSAKLMDALSPLNLTPKQNFENIPDPRSPNTQGSAPSFSSDSRAHTHIFNWWLCVCVHTCAHTCIFRLELIFTIGHVYTVLTNKCTSVNTNCPTKFLKHQTVHYRVIPRKMRSLVSFGNYCFTQTQHIANNNT